MASIGWHILEVNERMLELLCLVGFCTPFFAAIAMLLGIFAQGIMDMLEGRKKKKKKKKSSAARQQQQEVEETLLITWRQGNDG